jgi:hypothetical protein
MDGNVSQDQAQLDDGHVGKADQSAAPNRPPVAARQRHPLKHGPMPPLLRDAIDRPDRLAGRKSFFGIAPRRTPFVEGFFLLGDGLGRLLDPSNFPRPAIPAFARDLQKSAVALGGN